MVKLSKYQKETQQHLQNSTVIWLNVPFTDKDAAKKAGARWSIEDRKWYCLKASPLLPLMRAWLPSGLTVESIAKEVAKSKAARIQKTLGSSVRAVTLDEIVPEF